MTDSRLSYFDILYMFIRDKAIDILHLHSIDYHVIESHILHATLFIEPFYQRRIFTQSIINDIAESDIFNATSGLFVIRGIETDINMKQSSFLDIFHTYIFKQNFTDEILVSAIYRHAPLIW